MFSMAIFCRLFRVQFRVILATDFIGCTLQLKPQL
jgi:hypothetical protein